jgi:hypothetical protein
MGKLVIDVRGCLVRGVGAAHCCGFGLNLVDVDGVV